MEAQHQAVSLVPPVLRKRPAASGIHRRGLRPESRENLLGLSSLLGTFLVRERGSLLVEVPPAGRNLDPPRSPDLTTVVICRQGLCRDAPSRQRPQAAGMQRLRSEAEMTTLRAHPVVPAVELESPVPEQFDEHEHQADDRYDHHSRCPPLVTGGLILAGCPYTEPKRREHEDHHRGELHQLAAQRQGPHSSRSGRDPAVGVLRTSTGRDVLDQQQKEKRCCCERSGVLPRPVTPDGQDAETDDSSDAEYPEKTGRQPTPVIGRPHHQTLSTQAE